jgi:hypothetical protein
MDAKRRQQLALGVLVVLLAVLIYRAWPTTTGTAPSTSNGGAARGGVSTGGATPTAPDVHLEALEAPRPEPGDRERNLFKFQPRAAPAPPAAAVTETPLVPSAPPPPPPLPPIALKFIGVIEGERLQKIAVLSDSRGVYRGREGDIIEGRYRILRIGVESIEMAYLDGQGRQTIRLTGS